MIIRNWTPHTANEYMFKATFPLGNPTQRPVFFGNQPEGVQEGTDFSASVYTKETGNERAYLFGVRTARFRTNAKPEDRDEARAILTRNLPPPGLSNSEPKTVAWGGRQASETTWSDPAGSTKWVIRHFTTDDVLYIGYVCDLGSLPPAHVSTFFNSFEFLRKP
ncbi:MAG TPA: hypothetical protein VGE74_23140 [Gemmata sp.]